MRQILRCVIPILLGQKYKALACIYLNIHTVMNTTTLHLVAIYNIQLHVSALNIGHHQVVKIIVCFSQTMKFAINEAY